MAVLDTRKDLLLECEKGRSLLLTEPAHFSQPLIAPEVDVSVTASSMTHVDETSQMPDSEAQAENGTEGDGATARHEAVVPVNENRLQPTPIIFVDPAGRSWTFPFASCRTWDVSHNSRAECSFQLTASFRT